MVDRNRNPNPHIDTDIVFDFGNFKEVDDKLNELVKDLSRLRRKMLRAGEKNFDWRDMVNYNQKEMAVLTSHMVKMNMAYRMMNANQHQLYKMLDRIMPFKAFK